MGEDSARSTIDNPHELEELLLDISARMPKNHDEDVELKEELNNNSNDKTMVEGVLGKKRNWNYIEVTSTV